MPALALSVLVGSLAGLWVPVTDPVFAASPAILAGLPLWWLIGRNPCGLLFGFACASLSAQNYLALINDFAAAGEDVVVMGLITDFPRHTEHGYVFTMALSHVDSHRGEKRLRLTIYDDLAEPLPGEVWQLKVRLKPPHGQVNRGVFDRESWLMGQHIHATGYVRASPINTRIKAEGLRGAIPKLRATVRRQIEKPFGSHQQLPLLLGLTVGARETLSKTHWEVLRRTGTNHLMAISGLHIGLVAGLLWHLGYLCGFTTSVFTGRILSPVVVAVIFSSVSAFFYAALAGFAVTTVRALCMVLLWLFCAHHYRFCRPVTCLCFAFITILITDAFALLMPGFWLSFIAVAVLFLIAVPDAQDSVRQAIVFRYLKKIVTVQMLLSVGLIIPTILSFGQISVVSPLANLIAVPVFSLLIVPVALSGSLFLFIHHSVGVYMLNVVLFLLEQMMLMLGKLAAISFATLHWVSGWWADILPVALVCALLVASGLVACFWQCRLLVVLLMGYICIPQNTAQKNAFQLTVLDVGQGLAVVVQASGKTMVYDAGPAWPGGDAGGQVLLPVLQALQIKKVDLFVLSHADNDHRGGASSLLSGIEVTEFIAPPDIKVNSRVADPCRYGASWEWGTLKMRVLHPRDNRGWSENNASCVLQLEIHGKSILLPGDIEEEAEYVLTSRPGLRQPQLLLAPHHGSKTSSSKVFVQFMQPEFVVFAVGYKNRWGFPARAVQENWRKQGSCLLNTSVTGSISFQFTAETGFILTDIAAAGWNRPWAIRLRPGNICGNRL